VRTWYIVLNKTCVFFFQYVASNRSLVIAASLSRLSDHTQIHHTRSDSSGRAISPTQRPLPDNTQHSQETEFHAPAGFETHNPGKPTTTNRRLRAEKYNDVRNVTAPRLSQFSESTFPIFYISYKHRIARTKCLFVLAREGRRICYCLVHATSL